MLKTKILTNSNRRDEFVKCASDPIYFIVNYIRIPHPSLGIIPFEMFEYQKDCIKAFETHKYNVILKARQLGVSTVCAAYSLWKVLFRPAKTVLVVATGQRATKEFFDRVRVMYTDLKSDKNRYQILHKNIFPELEFSKFSLAFSHGSKIEAIPCNEQAIRSKAASLLIIDEAAFIDNDETIFKAAHHTIQHGEGAIFLSSPKNTKGKFYEYWRGAVEKTNDYNPIRLPWNVNPEHDQDWYQQQVRDLNNDMRAVKQELECVFVESEGNTYFEEADIVKVRASVKKPISFDQHYPTLWVWKEPMIGHRYVISADVSKGGEGADKDYSVFHVIDIDKGIVCAEFVGKIFPDELAELLVEYAKKYNRAYVCPEQNTFGTETLSKLYELKYNKVYSDKHLNYGMFVYGKDKMREAGFSTQTKSRNEALAKLYTLLRNNQIEVHSERFAKELDAFIVKNDKPQASSGNHDDVIMSLAIGAFLYFKFGNPTSTKSDTDEIPYGSFDPKQIMAMFQKRETSLSTILPDAANFGERLKQMQTSASEELVDYSKKVENKPETTDPLKARMLEKTGPKSSKDGFEKVKKLSEKDKLKIITNRKRNNQAWNKLYSECGWLI